MLPVGLAPGPEIPEYKKECEKGDREEDRHMFDPGDVLSQYLEAVAAQVTHPDHECNGET